MSTREEEIAALPVHQRPSPRELGRRSEAADHPFKAMKPDEVGGRGRGTPDVAGPHLARSPLVTAIADRQKMVIAAADAGARALGLSPGMALTHARALVPDLDVRDAQPAADQGLLYRLALFGVRRWTPTAMFDEDHGLLMDLSGVAHLHGGEAMMGHRVIRFCERLGLHARFAIAGNIGAAHALARYGRTRLTICDHQTEPEMLAPLPLAALRLSGGQLDASRKLGIDNIGDLIAMPRGPLSKRFGTSLLVRLDQAIGRMPEPFDAITPFVVPQVEKRFAEPIGSAEPITAAMAELVEALTGDLRARGLGARAIRLVCDRVDRADQIVTVGMARGTRDVRHILRLLSMKVETIDPGFGIDAMRLIAVRTELLSATHVEGDLGGGEAIPDIASLIDQIITRLGGRAVYRSGAVESYVPERSVRRFPANAELADWPARWPRPTYGRSAKDWSTPTPDIHQASRRLPAVRSKPVSMAIDLMLWHLAYQCRGRTSGVTARVRDDLNGPDKGPSPFTRLIDSALIIAAVLAALHFAGWTYRQTYLRPFSIDPNSIDGSSIAIAVEGLTAIMMTFASWLKAMLFLIVATASVCGLVYLGDRWRRRRVKGPIFDRVSILMVQAGVITLLLLLGIASGKIAGDRAVAELTADMRHCKVWSYQIGDSTIAGVMLVQSSTITWLLTPQGVKPVKTEDILLISGPTFAKVARVKDQSPAGLCTPQSH